MALESLSKIAPALFSPEQDLIEVYNKKTGTVGVINPSYIKSSPSGSAGAIQFSDGSAFASDAANLFWDDTNNRLGVGTNTPSATTHIVGVDQLNTSTSLLVQDSVGGNILRVHNQANNSAVVMSSAKIANYEVISGDVLANASMRFVPTTFGLGINRDYSNAAANTLVHIKGSGSTSATTSLLVQNSAGSQLFSVRDDGVVSVLANNMFTASIIAAGRIVLNSGAGDFTAFFEMNNNSGTPAIRAFNDNASVSVGIGTNTRIASAALFVDSTTKGFLPPRMTDAQIRAIASPAEGLVAYNTTISHLCCYQSGSWVKLNHSPM